VAKSNVLGGGDGVISAYSRNFNLLIVNSLQQLTFLFIYVMAMLKNIVTALGSRMTIIVKLISGFGVV